MHLRVFPGEQGMNARRIGTVVRSGGGCVKKSDVNRGCLICAWEGMVREVNVRAL